MLILPQLEIRVTHTNYLHTNFLPTLIERFSVVLRRMYMSGVRVLEILCGGICSEQLCWDSVNVMFIVKVAAFWKLQLR